MKATETILYVCTHADTRTHSCTALSCTNANCRKMLMPAIISKPPLSSLQQHSFRGHRFERESVPSWLLLIGQTGRLLPGYQLTLTHRQDFEYLPSYHVLLIEALAFFLPIIPLRFHSDIRMASWLFASFWLSISALYFRFCFGLCCE